MRGVRHSAGWSLRKERNEADATPGTTQISFFRSRDRAILPDDRAGSSLCRLATRRPHRLVLDQNRLGHAWVGYAELP